MPIRLSRFEMPHKVQLDEATKTATYTRFTAEPFEIGFIEVAQEIGPLPVGRRARQGIDGVADGPGVLARQSSSQAIVEFRQSHFGWHSDHCSFRSISDALIANW